MAHEQNKNIRLAILVSALGYFVDVFDLLLFIILRVPSLKDLSVSGDALTTVGIRLINIQLFGMLLGGILWGVIGDKKGRLSVLFGSIFLYSIANILNAFVTDVNTYAWLRFFAGLGLAGELGAGVTLVGELMPRHSRGLGIMWIAVAGVLGSVASALIGDFVSWRTAYFVGGVLGILLLILRIGVQESGLFSAAARKKIKRGSLLMFLRSPHLLLRFVVCLGIGMPIWIVIGIYMALAPEIGKAMHLDKPVIAGYALLFFNIGFGMGDLTSSLLSQVIKSRRKTIAIHLAFLLLSQIFFFWFTHTAFQFYVTCWAMGVGAGYWAVFLMSTSEQFGTNLRATVTTSIPNLVRGFVIPFSSLLTLVKPRFGLLAGLEAIGICTIVAAGLFLIRSKETFAIDLDFVD